MKVSAADLSSCSAVLVHRAAPMVAEPVWVMLLSARLGKGPVVEPLLSYSHHADSMICRVVLLRRAAAMAVAPVSPMPFPFRL